MLAVVLFTAAIFVVVVSADDARWYKCKPEDQSCHRCSLPIEEWPCIVKMERVLL